MWATPEELRKVLGLTVDQLSDSEATYWIQRGQEYVRLDTGIYVTVELTGSIDGSNKVFTAPLVPIGDGDFDLDVDANDIAVYGYTDPTDESTKVQLTVANVSPNTGRIELIDAPAGYAVIKASYWHSWALEQPVILGMATALASAYFFLISEYAFIPIQFVLESLKMDFKGPRGVPSIYPYHRYWLEYQRIVTGLKTKLITSLEREELAELEERP